MRSAASRVPAAERRRLIEQAASELFAERGYAATTVEDIVRAAGVTKPMLYRHFESKQELCVALLERYREELIAAPLATFTPGRGEWRDQLPLMLDAWLGYVEAHPAGTRLLFTPIHGDSVVERVQRDLHRRQRDTQIALLRELAPGIDQAEAEPLGEILRAGLAAVALWWLGRPGVPRAVPLRALRRLAEGILADLERRGATA